MVRWYGTCTDIEERKRAEARDWFLLALDAAVRPLTDPAEITQAHARLLGEHLEVDRCAYADVEADEDTFNLTGDHNRGVASIVGRYTFGAFGAEVLRLMREDKPYVVADVDAHEPPVGDKRAYRQTQIQAVICVPLHKEGKFVAAMAVHQKEPRAWRPEEVELVRHVAARCWESIERARVARAEREARAEAEAANRAKDRFLAVLSHELRTPLSPVVMTIPAMEADGELPAKFREELAMVRRNIDLEVKLIDDLLDLSRVTSGKLRLELQGVRAHEVLRHAVRNSVPEAQGKRLEIREVLGAADDALLADPGRLQQVFWNLLRNAVKFTPEGGEIEVRTWNRAEGQLVVEVQDSGVGIPAEVLPRVFDAFEQGDVRMTRQFGGLGLGLAIAKAVVEMHGGTIRAASEGVGRGATFSVELQTSAAPKRAELPAPQEGTRVAAAQATRVLLAEDHPDTARTMARLLAALGFEVKAANSVAGALALAAGERFDVMVSDIGLPDGTGYELMEQIRRRHGMKGIALSGYGMEEDVRRSREAGFSEHMVKPINVASLEGVLRRVVGGRELATDGN
jgi:signal transduction histidine kinase/ActR/RegA family two-component response regulator